MGRTKGRLNNKTYHARELARFKMKRTLSVVFNEFTELVRRRAELNAAIVSMNNEVLFLDDKIKQIEAEILEAQCN